MTGKDKCRYLKEIRRQIAQANDIRLIIEECTHKGECRGTCPRCEAEVRALEAALEKRRQLGRRVALAGVSAGLTLALSGCSAVDWLIEAAARRPAVVTPAPDVEIELDGMVAPEPDLTPEPELTGLPTFTPSPTPDVEVLDGEVPLIDMIEEDGTGV